MKLNLKKIYNTLLFIMFVFSFLGIFATNTHGQTAEKWWYIYQFDDNTYHLGFDGKTYNGFIKFEDCKTDQDKSASVTNWKIITPCKQYSEEPALPNAVNGSGGQTYAEKWYYLQADGKRIEPPYDTQADCKKEQEKPVNNAQSDCYTLYQALAPLPGFPAEGLDPVGTSFVGYLNIFFKLIIGIATVLAVVMIVVGGIQYMTSDLPFAKGEAKNRMTGAIFGLILALVAWLIIYTLNPDILKGTFDIGFQKGSVSNTTSTSLSAQKVTVNGAVLTACDTTAIVETELFGKKVKVNKAILANVQAVDTAWKALPKTSAGYTYGLNADLSAGGYVCKPSTGQTAKASGHSYGISIDINPATNPFSADPKHCVTDMPVAFINLFRNNGWGWGGNWNSVKDAMHFSMLPDEVGSNASCKP